MGKYHIKITNNTVEMEHLSPVIAQLSQNALIVKLDFLQIALKTGAAWTEEMAQPLKARLTTKNIRYELFVKLP